MTRRAAHAARQVLPDRAREGPARRLPRRHADVRSDGRSEPLDPAARVIEDKIRFTFQFAKRFGWLTLRYGIKESTGGVGADVDVHWFNRNLRLSVDVFDATFDKFPRVKLTAAYRGVPPPLRPRRRRRAAQHARRRCRSSTGTSDVPIQFDDVPLRPRLLRRRRCCASTTRISRRCSRSAARRSRGRALGPAAEITSSDCRTDVHAFGRRSAAEAAGCVRSAWQSASTLHGVGGCTRRGARARQLSDGRDRRTAAGMCQKDRVGDD